MQQLSLENLAYQPLLAQIMQQKFQGMTKALHMLLRGEVGKVYEGLLDFEILETEISNLPKIQQN